MVERKHIPVMLNEVIESLDIHQGGTYIDGTFGAGGYSEAILNAAPDTRVLAIDQDPNAIRDGQALVKKYAPRLQLYQKRFSQMAEIATEPVDGVVLDIGVSSMQIDQPERGFSFQKSGPLDMRMSQQGLCAADIVNTFKEDEIADILFHYGEERAARRIAHQIITQRTITPFTDTLQLACAIHAVMPHKAGDIDSATRTFQALRIYVNNELGELEKALEAAKKVLKPNGVLSVVTFHSLEDRIVKQFFQSETAPNVHVNKYKKDEALAPSLCAFCLKSKKPLAASEAETKINPRARSARLRSAVRLKDEV